MSSHQQWPFASYRTCLSEKYLVNHNEGAKCIPQFRDAYSSCLNALPCGPIFTMATFEFDFILCLQEFVTHLIENVCIF